MGIAFFTGCGEQPGNDASPDTIPQSVQVKSQQDPFADYWYQGLAEVSTYELQQARYGEIRKGHANLIFVTEPFSKSKQVKLDRPQAAGDDKVTVLKLNATRKFNTGIYPYSIMQSTFTPVSYEQHPHALKSTVTVQEWCGQVFGQLNYDKSHYDYQAFSYFESEGDVEKKLGIAWLEDELWARIRIAPESLPTGEIDLIPSLAFSRLRHIDLKPEKARVSLEKNGDATVLRIEYQSIDRSMIIRFQSAFPHEILSWEETYPSGGRKLTTRAEKVETLKIDYWSRNANEDLYLRDSLQLPR